MLLIKTVTTSYKNLKRHCNFLKPRCLLFFTRFMPPYPQLKLEGFQTACESCSTLAHWSKKSSFQLCESISAILQLVVTQGKILKAFDKNLLTLPTAIFFRYFYFNYNRVFSKNFVFWNIA